MVETLLPVLMAHWPFIAVAAVLWSLGQAAKALAPKTGAWVLYRKTLPWHPVLAGLLIGALCPALLPVAVADGRAFAALYFAAAGVASTYWHDALRTWQKHKRQPAG